MAPNASADPMRPRFVRVRRRRREAPDIWTLALDDVAAEGAPGAIVPGQFNMLSVAGVGEVPISLCGPGVHSIRVVGPVSAALTQCRRGVFVGVRGPFGVGWPVALASGRDVVIVAGGLGFAPLRPALIALARRLRRAARLLLLHGARSPETLLYRREMAGWRKRGVEIELTVDHAGPDWSGHVGVVPDLIAGATFDPTRALAFVCGPEVMMRYSIAALRARGVAETAIYLSLERNMQCGVGLCGRCQLGRHLLCRDGPVLRYDAVRDELAHREI